MSKNIIITFLCSVIFFVLSGCVPPYPIVESENAASIKLLNMGSAQICEDGNLYRILPTDDSKSALVPAGERISIGTFVAFGNNYNCFPFLSFIPKEGETYILNNYLHDNKCFIEVVREDSTKASGIGFEPTMGPRNCYAKANR